MSNGMLMMLKSFGLDPKMFEQIGAVVTQLANDIKTIKEQNTQILLALSQIKDQGIEVDENGKIKFFTSGAINGGRS